MIYWQISTPGKSWQVWSSGTAATEDEAYVDAMFSVLDENRQLLPWANGIAAHMWECTPIDDFRITAKNADAFRKNYLGIE